MSGEPTDAGRLDMLERWVENKAACGSWPAGCREFLAKIQEVKKTGEQTINKEKGK